MSKPTYSTALAKINDTFLPMIESQLVGNGMNMDPYAKQCVMSALSSINAALDAKQITINDEQLDKNNLTTILLNVAALKLNAAASPREVYFTVRNVKTGRKDGSNRDIYKKQIEMGIEGDGNDAILSRFGRNVEQVRPYWLVREDDLFEYPTFSGLEMTPPKWSPRGTGQVVRIVYPIIFKDKSIQYFIGERADVDKNLIAHINNNLMNETFDVMPVGKTRYDANADQKKKINEKKAAVMKKVVDLGLNALDDPELQQYISPAWSEYQSRESMIIRKIRNNIVKKIPKDFGNAFVEMLHSEATDDNYYEARQEISERANSEPIDVSFNAQTVAYDEEHEEHEQEQEVSQQAQQQPAQDSSQQQPASAAGPDF